jgi:hypothetical protein
MGIDDAFYTLVREIRKDKERGKESRRKKKKAINVRKKCCLLRPTVLSQHGKEALIGFLSNSITA